MSRPITITEDLYEKILEDFKKQLQKTKSANGKISYTCNLSKMDDRRVEVQITPTAWIKMNALIQEYASEVGWHGLAERTEEGFLITDLLVYPQSVTGSTVTTDQEELGKWLAGFDAETLKKIRFHGHSHVNFGVTPSTVDINQRQEFLGQLGKDDFYIFLIMNKKGACSAAVYDLKENLLYETEDVDLVLVGVEPDTFSFVQDTKGLVTQKSVAAAVTKAAKATAAPAKKNEKAQQQYDFYSYTQQYGVPYWDEEDDELYARKNK